MTADSESVAFSHAAAKETQIFLKPLTKKISSVLCDYGHKTAIEYIDIIINTLEAMKKTIEYNAN